MSRSLYARLARRYGPPVDRLTRREMLRATLAASAGLLLTGCSDPPRIRQKLPPNGRRVAVIGAGFAGLACAHELIWAGYDVTVLEARARAGGRVLTLPDFVPGKTVEGGGELIGSNHPSWVGYAKQFNLPFLDVTESDDAAFPVYLQGRPLSAAESERLYEEMTAALAQLNDQARPIDADEPWNSPNAAELDRMPTKVWLEGLGPSFSSLCARALAAQFTGDNGVDPRLQSHLGNLVQIKGGGLEKYWTESEVYRCQGGNSRLAQKFVDAIGPVRLCLKSPVASIRSSDRAVVVTGADGRIVEADDVVLTVPPTVWHKIRFDPALPADLAPQMGLNVKYLAALKSRFWKRLGLAPDAMTDEMITMTWEGTDNQAGDAGAAMVAFSGGPPAAKARALPPDRRDAAYAAELERLYPGYGAQFVKSRFMDWPGDPWTMGGYSFPAPGQVTTMGPVLREGIGRLHFAGEHTCYKFVGYMEGALSSGAAVARRLASRDGVVARLAAAT